MSRTLWWEVQGLFGDDPHDTAAVAESIVRCTARPVHWLEQAYRLKRLADELIDRWCEAVKVSFEALEEHYERFPMDWRFNLDLKPGDLVPDRPGERESESRLRQIQSRVAEGSPATYMQLAGQSVENLVKGLWVREHPEAVRSAGNVADGGAVLEPPANRHETLHLLGPANLDVPLPDDEKNVARRLELAVLWHGRYPIPIRVGQTKVQPLDGEDESNSLGFWATSFRPIVDRLYERLFNDLVEPGWYPYWEPDKFPVY